MVVVPRSPKGARQRMPNILDDIIPKPGDLVGGRYEVLHELGRGGFGVVFRARQSGLDEDVAVKILLPHVVTREDVNKRFQREILLAKGLRHPNTIRLLDVGETKVGLPFYVMEYVDSRPLDDVLDVQRKLSPEQTRRIAEQVLGSLSEAHSNGIIHRDLKPENILLCEIVGTRDFVKVVDFGIAKALFDPQDHSKITKTDVVMGTPTYMSPEQCRGREMSGRSDLYAVGLIMAECLTGRAVLDGKTMLSILKTHASPKPLVFAKEIRNCALWPIIKKATDKDARMRFPSAEVMAECLKALPRLTEDRLKTQALDTMVTAANKVKAPYRFRKTDVELDDLLQRKVMRDRNRQRAFLLGAGLLSAAAAALLFFADRGGQPHVEADQPAIAQVPIEEEASSPPALPPRAPDRESTLLAVAFASERAHQALPATGIIRFVGQSNVDVFSGDLLLGTTPFEWPTMRLDYAVGVTFRADGFRPGERTVSLLDQEVAVDMVRRRERRRERVTSREDRDDRSSEGTSTSPDDDNAAGIPFGGVRLDPVGR